MILKNLISGKKIAATVGRYKYVLIVILAGVLLLTLPPLSGRRESGAQAPLGPGYTFSLGEMEEKMERALSKIDGAGNVTVVLTVKTGARKVLAEDEGYRRREEETEESKSTVVLSKGAGSQDVVAVQEIYPQYQGALVVCAGAGNPAVKLKLVEAVSALTGLGSDRISICKGK